MEKTIIDTIKIKMITEEWKDYSLKIMTFMIMTMIKKECLIKKSVIVKKCISHNQILEITFLNLQWLCTDRI